MPFGRKKKSPTKTATSNEAAATPNKQPGDGSVAPPGHMSQRHKELIDFHRVLFTGREKTTVGDGKAFGGAAESLRVLRMDPKDMPRLLLQVSIYGVDAVRYTDSSGFLDINILAIKYIATVSKMLIFMAQDSIVPGSSPNYTTYAFLCENDEATKLIGTCLSQARKTVRDSLSKAVEYSLADGDRKTQFPAKTVSTRDPPPTDYGMLEEVEPMNEYFASLEMAEAGEESDYFEMGEDDYLDLVEEQEEADMAAGIKQPSEKFLRKLSKKISRKESTSTNIVFQKQKMAGSQASTQQGLKRRVSKHDFHK